MPEPGEGEILMRIILSLARYIHARPHERREVVCEAG